VFADAEKSNAIERAEILRASIADAGFSALHALGPGVACFPVDFQSARALLEKADEVVDHSKKTGRDGVSLCSLLKVRNRGDSRKRHLRFEPAPVAQN
jgi:hypothetical protein